MRTALLTALADGAGGDAGRQTVGELAGVLGLDAGASAQALAEAAGRPDRREAVRAWGDRVVELLAADPLVAGAVAAAMERRVPGSGAAWYGGDHSDFRGGVFLREVVGVQVVIQQGGAAAAPEALSSLPPRPGGFTGRDEETDDLLRALDPAAAPPSPGGAVVLAAAVSGLGGVGKTALAVETAHLACAKGWFPGGVLFIDLHGYDEEPVTADQALQSLLRALGVPPEHIPARADDRGSLYRSVLAERARERGPVLLLADNASSPDQVRPLLPGDTRHRVLVTSRDRLPQLGARLVPLVQLTSEAAYELLDLALRIGAPDDSRVADDSDAAEQLALVCGYLPLALQIAAALLVEDPDKPVAELVADLAVSRDRLADLDDGERSVRAAFDLSYRRLPPEQARLLRLLALAPGAEVSDEIVSALVGGKVAPLRGLRALTRAHLVERGSASGWWRLHDLVRAFGVGLVTGDVGLREEGEAAREQVLGFYWRWAKAADNRLRWLPGRAEPERFADRGQALAWFDGERAGLVAAVLWAREERYAHTAVLLAECLAEYLGWRRYFDDWIAVGRAALEAAHHAGDRFHEAGAWINLGRALWEADRTEETIEAHTRALDLYQAVGDRPGEASAWANLGLALRVAGRVGEAVEAHTRALDLFRTAGNTDNEARAWNNLGVALRVAGRVGEAVEAHTRALDLRQTSGDRRGEARAWEGLGVTLREAGRVEESIEAHSKALAIYEEFEDWYRVGSACHNLASTHDKVGRHADGRVYWLQAADAYARGNAPAKANEIRTWVARVNDPTP